MRTGRVREAARCGAILISVLPMAGCPIPVPGGYQASSRENVPAEPVDWVTTGVTTREDVLMQLGEAVPVQVTFGTGTVGDGGATWSPDGSRIAFHSDRGGNLDIYVIQ